MTEKELRDEKSSRIGKFKVDLASNAGIAQAIDAAVYYGLGLPYLDEFSGLVSAVTREQANEAIARLVQPDASRSCPPAHLSSESPEGAGKCDKIPAK